MVTNRRIKNVKQRTIAETVLKFYTGVMARPWGIAEQYGGYAEMFNSEQWQRPENRKRIPKVIHIIEDVAELYQQAANECRDYAEKHGIE